MVVVSGIAEGIGISLFIPLLHIMGGNELVDLPKVFSFAINILSETGITANIGFFLILITGLSLLALAIAYIQQKLLLKSKSEYSCDLSNALFGSLVSASWDFASKKSHGEMVNEVVVECARAGNALAAEMMAVAAIIQIALYVIFSAAISWELMITAALFGGLVYLVVKPLTERAKVLGEKTSSANRNLSFYCLEYLNVLKILKSTASENVARNSMDEKNKDVYSIAVDSELNAARVNFLVQALPVLLMAIIIGFSFEVLKLPMSSILVFLVFMMRIAPRIGRLQQLLQSYYQRSPAVRVVREAIEISQAAHQEINPGGIAFKSLEKSIVLDKVFFSYPDTDEPAINDISLTIQRNQIAAFVGGSGAGKSTVMDIMLGLRKPDSGRVLIDGNNLQDLDLNSWRRSLGFVPQETTTFNASLRDNLKFFAPDASDEEVNKALSMAQLEGLLADLPEGLDTIVGERGIRFSGGQKQRITLARALSRMPQVLFLDEATSNLDNESERFIQDAISSLAQSMTIVVIAHRLSTVRRADIIFVMEEGRIVESGSYEQLLSRGGRFANLHNLEL